MKRWVLERFHAAAAAPFVTEAASRRRRILAGVMTTLLLGSLILPAGNAAAQGFGGPLTVEGLQQQNNHSAAARGFGAVSLTREGNAGLMFVNPSSLHPLDGIQITIAGTRRERDLQQEQHFAPVRYYPNLSLLLEGMTDGIPDPDTTLIGFTPADTVQRPFDDIQPNWSQSNSSTMPLHAMVAVPFTVGDITLTAGIGAVEYANLNHYYQNNNVLNPSVLSQRPLPTRRPTDDNPLVADWYQTLRSRDGTMRGYGAALAAHVSRYGLTLGVSGLLLDGSANDFEQRVNRGTLTFLANEFRADSSFGHVTRQGTSEFSGSEFSIGATLSGEFVSAGVVVRPPTTITRSFEMNVETDTTGSAVTSTTSGEDRFQLPWRGTVGLLLQPRDRLHIGVEYELRPYASARLTAPDGGETTPWESASVFRIGTQYELIEWLTIRGGLRREADVFVPDGSAIVDDPVTYRVYSVGAGVRFFGLEWNLTYENAQMRYQDIWGSALSNNTDARHSIVSSITYTIPAI